jgi:hypothetical protein
LERSIESRINCQIIPEKHVKDFSRIQASPRNIAMMSGESVRCFLSKIFEVKYDDDERLQMPD